MSGQKRPFVTLCQATSLDGRIASAPDKGPNFTSRKDLHHLFERRAEADILLIGAGTVRTEETLPLVRVKALSEKRTATGKSPHPDAAIVSTSLNLPFDGRYFRLKNRKQKLIIITTQVPGHLKTKLDDLQLEVIETGPILDLEKALQILAKKGYQDLLAEGGGSLTASLLKSDLIDRIYLTLAPTVFGNKAPSLVNGDLQHTSRNFRLHSLRQEGDEVFLRYDRSN